MYIHTLIENLYVVRHIPTDSCVHNVCIPKIFIRYPRRQKFEKPNVLKLTVSLFACINNIGTEMNTPKSCHLAPFFNLYIMLYVLVSYKTRVKTGQHEFGSK